MILKDLLKLVDSQAELVITDGLSEVHRCITATVPIEFLQRSVSFLSASTIGGLHLRIVIQPASWNTD